MPEVIFGSSQPDTRSLRSAGFDFTSRIRLLCADMIARTPELAHVDLSLIAVTFSQARKGVSWGMYASLTPLRFAGGSRTTLRRGREYQVQRIVDGSGREMLYLLSFYLPRFMNLAFREKLITVFHELWHIGPEFDGDLRRHEGRCFAHTHSQAEYDRQMGILADRWLAQSPDPALWNFLQQSFPELHAASGPIYGLRIKRPKLVPVS
jgi:predicted metallopeptidase